VTGENATFTIDQDRVGEAKLEYTVRYLPDLLARVCPGIAPPVREARNGQTLQAFVTVQEGGDDISSYVSIRLGASAQTSQKNSDACEKAQMSWSRANVEKKDLLGHHWLCLHL
jgi:hypothetical protein